MLIIEKWVLYDIRTDEKVPLCQFFISNDADSFAYYMHVIVGFQNYRVAQNKPDYLLLLSKFCISATKHLSMKTYV